MRSPRLLVIVGPTGSGKSRLALEVADRIDGEVVSADAFAVYRGMDIGTDKPSPQDRRRVVHHLLDVADPCRRFSAGDFVRRADQAIEMITKKGRTVVIAGGTHFYLRALLLGLFPSPPKDPEVRRRLEEAWRLDPDQLRRRLTEVDPVSADRIQSADRQRILRALEVYEISGLPLSEHWKRHDQGPRYPSLLAAPQRARDELYVRIGKRVEAMFSAGLVEEVQALLASGVPADSHAMKAIGYREAAQVLCGEIGLAEAKERTVVATRHLAKRQLTWLRHLREGPLHSVRPWEHDGCEELLTIWNRNERGRLAP